MTEREIQLLGFTRWTDDSDPEVPFYYYTYTVAMGVEFITSSNDEVENENDWWVDFFETDPAIRFWKFEEIQNLINILERHLIK